MIKVTPAEALKSSGATHDNGIQGTDNRVTRTDRRLGRAAHRVHGQG